VITMFLTMIIALLLGMVVFLIDQLVKAKDRQIDQLQTELETLVERKRHTGATMAGLEDAMATLINIQYNREIDNHRLDFALNTLQQLRKGPYAYDPNKKSGEREEYK